MCFTSTVWYGIIVQAPLFNLYYGFPCTTLICHYSLIVFTVRLPVLFTNSPYAFTSFCTIIKFRIKEKDNSLLISNIENIQFMIDLF